MKFTWKEEKLGEKDNKVKRNTNFRGNVNWYQKAQNGGDWKKNREDLFFKNG